MSNTKFDQRNPQISEKKTAWHDQNHLPTESPISTDLDHP